MNQFSLSIEDTLYDITEKHPETIDIFTSRGFPQMGDKAKREGFGKTINLKTALMLKGISSESFISLLRERIEGDSTADDVTLKSGPLKKGKALNGKELKIMGLLPCPVRIPLMEGFEKFASDYTDQTGTALDYQLQAASLGLEWVEEHILKEGAQLPDLFLSAGFDLFFDEKKIGHHRKKGMFKDMTGLSKINKDFEGLDIFDPEGHYSIIGTVPALFLVNTEELKGRKKPESWADILSPEFENSVSLPIGDFDLFNAILLSIHKTYGKEGVRKLGRSLLESMHPSEMVKSAAKKGNKPAVTIMPAFFTRMTGGKGPLTAVWPSDGAIISPIFMLSKAEKEEELKPIVEYFASQKVGEVLAHQGRFPSTHPDVDNRFEDSNYMWIGWDYIKENDIGALIIECMELFEESSKEIIG